MQLFFLNVLFFCLFVFNANEEVFRGFAAYCSWIWHRTRRTNCRKTTTVFVLLWSELNLTDTPLDFFHRPLNLHEFISHLDREIKLKTLKWLLADTERLYPKRIGICWTAAASSENLTYKLPLSDVLVSFSILGYWDICMCNTCLPSFSFSVLFNFKEY